MTLTLELAPELERRLREAADREGEEASEYVIRLIEQHLPSGVTASPSLWETLSPEEWSRAFHEWAHRHTSAAPPLSDEAISRESIYEGNPRWPI